MCGGDSKETGLKMNRARPEERQVRQLAKRGTRPRQPADQPRHGYCSVPSDPVRGVGARSTLPYAEKSSATPPRRNPRHVAKRRVRVLLLDAPMAHRPPFSRAKKHIPIEFFEVSPTNPVENTGSTRARQLASKCLQKWRASQRRQPNAAARRSGPAPGPIVTSPSADRFKRCFAKMQRVCGGWRQLSTPVTTSIPPTSFSTFWRGAASGSDRGHHDADQPASCPYAGRRLPRYDALRSA